MKLVELKKVNIEVFEVKKIIEVFKELKDGEFIIYVVVKESFDFKFIMINLKDKEIVKEIVKEMINKVNDFVNNVLEGKENFFVMGGGVLFILNILFFVVVIVKFLFFGNYLIGFFKGLFEVFDFSKEVRNF